MRPNSVFSIFIAKAMAGEPITIQGTGGQSRQFTHARDIARAFALAAVSDVHGEALNIVAEESTSIKELAYLVRARIPTDVTYAPARAGEISPARVCAERAERVLGWSSEVTFAEGLNEIIDELAGRPLDAASVHQQVGDRA